MRSSAARLCRYALAKVQVSREKQYRGLATQLLGLEMVKEQQERKAAKDRARPWIERSVEAAKDRVEAATDRYSRWSEENPFWELVLVLVLILVGVQILVLGPVWILIWWIFLI